MPDVAESSVNGAAAQTDSTAAPCPGELSELGRAALEYAAGGLQVFPVYGIRDGRCMCADQACDRPGKHPVRELVHDGLKSATTNPALISAWWTNAPWANVGMRTGPESGIWVLDVDPRHGGEETLEALEQAHGPLPNTLTASTPSGGKHLVFRWPEARHIRNSGGKLGCGLDVRGDNGYIVAEPSIGASGRHYAWLDCDGFERADVAEAPAWLVELVEARPERPATDAAPTAAPARLMPDQVADLRSALACLDPDPYDTWTEVGIALATCEPGRELWLEWSARSPKFDPDQAAEKWQTFRANSTSWQAVFARAQGAGWINPASSQAPPRATPVGRSAMPAVPVDPDALTFATTFAPDEVPELPADTEGEGFPEPPAEVMQLSGALAVLFDHYLSSTRYPQPVFGLAASLAAVATALGRNYRFRGTAPNLYLAMCGPTGCGKDDPRKLAEYALTAAGMSERIGPGGIASGAGIEDHMTARPVCLWCLDELGKMLGAVATDKGRQADMLAVLMRLYSASTGTYRGRALAGLDRSGAVREIEAPAATILGASTPDALRTALSGSDAESGFLGRLLFFCTNDARPARKSPRTALERIPDAWHTWTVLLGAVDPPRGNLERLGLTAPIVPPIFRAIEAAPDAERALDAYADECDEALRAHMGAASRSGLVRSAETACKFALVAAVSDAPAEPIVKADHAHWAVALARYLASVFQVSFAERIGGSEHHADLMQLREYVHRARAYGNDRFRTATKRGLMPRRYLLKLAKMRAQEADKLIETLVEMGEIQDGLASPNPHGFTGKVYWPGENYGDDYKPFVPPDEPSAPPAQGAR
jgi:hypothetical protein